VVEDHPDTAQTMAVLVGIFGHEVELAPDGPTALQLAQERPPDVALLDIGLPGLNGYEVARRLRDQVNGRKLLLVAVTGYGQDSDRLRSVEAGIHLHFLKPMDPAALRQILDGYKALLQAESRTDGRCRH
jgi:two-component system OmpR family response regulator